MRKIIHCDCDCFFASVEMRDDSSLRGRPMAVGGTGARGVIATCNYEARAFGVRSAMPVSQARRLCPGLILLPPSMERYRVAAHAVRHILLGYSDRVESFSLDEAYLDVSDSLLHEGSATRIAGEIRQRVREEVGITISAGVAPNKFLAKIASDWHKPDGLFVIPPRDVPGFVAKLPVERLPGVGKVMAARLHQRGWRLCSDLREASPAEMLHRFGVFGPRLLMLANGVDDREVSDQHERKSVSVEHTYAQDIPTLEACRLQLPALYQQLQVRLQRMGGAVACVAPFVKLRFSDFQSTTQTATGLALCMDSFQRLLESAFARRHQPVRLIGLGMKVVDLRERGVVRQLELFPAAC